MTNLYNHKTGVTVKTEHFNRFKLKASAVQVQCSSSNQWGSGSLEVSTHKSQFSFFQLAFSTRCRFSLWSSLCCRARTFASSFGTPSSRDQPDHRWSRTAGWYRTLLMDCWDSSSLDALRRSCKHLPCTRWQIRNRNKFFLLASWLVEQARWCETWWLVITKYARLISFTQSILTLFK